MHHHQIHIAATPSRAARSYTLIELLIVIGILGIASSLLIPHLVNRDSMNVQAAVRLVIGDLCFAQSDALAHQEMRRVHFYEDGRGYCIVRIKDSVELSQSFDPDTAEFVHDPLASGAELGHYIVDFTTDPRFRGVKIVDVEIDGDDMINGVSMHYDELGGTITSGSAPGSGGYIEIESGEDRYRITVSPFTGKLTVSEV
jgi:prepilin-type N-terminal cleavage/methylation domain-containing protein